MRFAIYRGGHLIERKDRHVSCKQCKSVFEAMFGHNTICSDRCRLERKNAARRKPRQSYLCGFCGNEFSGYACVSWNRPRYCSRKCKRDAESKRRTDWKIRKQGSAWKSVRTIPCLICGFSRIINACHVIPVALGGPEEVWNLIALCPNHHWLFDHNKLLDEEMARIADSVNVAKLKFQAMAVACR